MKDSPFPEYLAALVKASNDKRFNRPEYPAAFKDYVLRRLELQGRSHNESVRDLAERIERIEEWSLPETLDYVCRDRNCPFYRKIGTMHRDLIKTICLALHRKDAAFFDRLARAIRTGVQRQYDAREIAMYLHMELVEKGEVSPDRAAFYAKLRPLLRKHGLQVRNLNNLLHAIGLDTLWPPIPEDSRGK
jgi:hypothetical protein